MFENTVKKSFTSKKYELWFAKFMFYLFKIFGILTMSYNHAWITETASWNLIFKFSWTGLVYSVLLIIFLLFSEVIEIHSQINDKSFELEAKENFILIVLAYSSRLFNILIVLTFVFQQTKMVSISNKIIKLRVLAAETFVTENKLFVVYIGHSMMAFMLHFILIYQLPDSFSIQILMGFVVYLLFIQYCLLLKILKSFYEFINTALQKLFNNHSYWNLENHNTHLKIDQLMYFYSCIYDLSQELSEFYSLPMIFAILKIYIYLLFYAHALTKSFILNNSNFLKNLISFIIIYLSILSLAILVICVTNTIKEVNISNSFSQTIQTKNLFFFCIFFENRAKKRKKLFTIV